MAQQNLQQVVITDPELLAVFTRLQHEDKSEVAYLKRAIGCYEASLLASEDSVVISKQDLKRMYSEWNSIEQLVKSISNFKPKTLLKIRDINSDTVRQCHACKYKCGLTFSTKIGVGVHERKCKNNPIVNEAEDNAQEDAQETPDEENEENEEAQEASAPEETEEVKISQAITSETNEEVKTSETQVHEANAPETKAPENKVKKKVVSK